MFIARFLNQQSQRVLPSADRRDPASVSEASLLLNPLKDFVVRSLIPTGTALFQRSSSGGSDSPLSSKAPPPDARAQVPQFSEADQLWDDFLKDALCTRAGDTDEDEGPHDYEAVSDDFHLFFELEPDDAMMLLRPPPCRPPAMWNSATYNAQHEVICNHLLPRLHCPTPTLTNCTVGAAAAAEPDVASANLLAAAVTCISTREAEIEQQIQQLTRYRDELQPKVDANFTATAEKWLQLAGELEVLVTQLDALESEKDPDTVLEDAASPIVSKIHNLEFAELYVMKLLEAQQLLKVAESSHTQFGEAVNALLRVAQITACGKAGTQLFAGSSLQGLSDSFSALSDLWLVRITTNLNCDLNELDWGGSSFRTSNTLEMTSAVASLKKSLQHLAQLEEAILLMRNVTSGSRVLGRRGPTWAAAILATRIILRFRLLYGTPSSELCRLDRPGDVLQYMEVVLPEHCDFLRRLTSKKPSAEATSATSATSVTSERRLMGRSHYDGKEHANVLTAKEAAMSGTSVESERSAKGGGSDEEINTAVVFDLSLLPTQTADFVAADVSNFLLERLELLSDNYLKDADTATGFRLPAADSTRKGSLPRLRKLVGSSAPSVPSLYRSIDETQKRELQYQWLDTCIAIASLMERVSPSSAQFLLIPENCWAQIDSATLPSAFRPPDTFNTSSPGEPSSSAAARVSPGPLHEVVQRMRPPAEAGPGERNILSPPPSRPDGSLIGPQYALVRRLAEADYVRMHAFMEKEEGDKLSTFTAVDGALRRLLTVVVELIELTLACSDRLAHFDSGNKGKKSAIVEVYAEKALQPIWENTRNSLRRKWRHSCISQELSLTTLSFACCLLDSVAVGVNFLTTSHLQSVNYLTAERDSWKDMLEQFSIAAENWALQQIRSNPYRFASDAVGGLSETFDAIQEMNTHLAVPENRVRILGSVCSRLITELFAYTQWAHLNPRDTGILISNGHRLLEITQSLSKFVPPPDLAALLIELQAFLQSNDL